MCCPRGGQDCTNAEFKAFDGSTNPYIGLAALVAAGMQGKLGVTECFGAFLVCQGDSS